MRRIVRYEIPDHGPTAAHRDAKLLHVDLRGDDVHVWAEANTDEPLVDRHLLVMLTGDRVPDGTDLGLPASYVASAQRRDPDSGDEWFVVHLYDAGESEGGET